MEGRKSLMRGLDAVGRKVRSMCVGDWGRRISVAGAWD